MPRGGWVRHNRGRDCVVIRQEHSILRVGSDDAPNRAAFLAERIGQP